KFPPLEVLVDALEQVRVEKRFYKRLLGLVRVHWRQNSVGQRGRDEQVAVLGDQAERACGSYLGQVCAIVCALVAEVGGEVVRRSAAPALDVDRAGYFERILQAVARESGL